MTTQAKIYIAGHHGMVGSAIIRTLQAQGQTHALILNSPIHSMGFHLELRVPVLEQLLHCQQQ